MRIHISHRTTYRFDQPVHYGLQRLRLTPRSGSTQTVVDWELVLSGCGLQLEYEDHFGNHVTLVRTDGEALEVDIEARGLVETFGSDGVVGQHHGAVPLWFHLRPTELTTPGDRIRELAAEVAFEADPVTRLHALSGVIIDQVEYRLGGTEPSTPAEEALKSGHGVCQDHAHIFVTAARLFDVPARYVSGYMMLDDAESSPASHAWAEAHVAGLGWVGFDVSNGISPDDRYVRVAIGRDYREAAPLVGTRYGSGGESLEVRLEISAQAQAQAEPQQQQQQQ
ncbi:MAG: transglutaminase family protein [Acidimicrobiia bacterium]|nr:transglutaminase family protein [Acidimicrobiia bacterium]